MRKIGNTDFNNKNKELYNEQRTSILIEKTFVKNPQFGGVSRNF
jgi:hypothetical protein